MTHTPGPYSWDAFNEILAGEPRYDAMIIGGDGETIVAQCVAERDVGLFLASPDMLAALYAARDAANELELSGAYFPRGQIENAIARATGALA